MDFRPLTEWNEQVAFSTIVLPPCSPTIPAYETLIIQWSREGWSDQSKLSGYQQPAATSQFKGATLSEQITLLMMRHFDSLEDEMKVATQTSPEAQVERIIATTDLFLADVERLIMSAITDGLNHHQLIHIQELTKNCLRALIAIAQAILLGGFGDEEKDTQTIQLHPDLCGLLRDADGFWGHSGHQNERLPYSPSRVGHEVTYEEIANLFRTSRVNIRRVEHEGCFRKLRVKLQAFRITEA